MNFKPLIFFLFLLSFLLSPTLVNSAQTSSQLNDTQTFKGSILPSALLMKSGEIIARRANSSAITVARNIFELGTSSPQLTPEIVGALAGLDQIAAFIRHCPGAPLPLPHTTLGSLVNRAASRTMSAASSVGSAACTLAFNFATSRPVLTMAIVYGGYYLLRERLDLSSRLDALQAQSRTNFEHLLARLTGLGSALANLSSGIRDLRTDTTEARTENRQAHEKTQADLKTVGEHVTAVATAVNQGTSTIENAVETGTNKVIRFVQAEEERSKKEIQQASQKAISELSTHITQVAAKEGDRAIAQIQRVTEDISRNMIAQTALHYNSLIELATTIHQHAKPMENNLAWIVQAIDRLERNQRSNPRASPSTSFLSSSPSSPSLYSSGTPVLGLQPKDIAVSGPPNGNPYMTMHMSTFTEAIQKAFENARQPTPEPRKVPAWAAFLLGQQYAAQKEAFKAGIVYGRSSVTRS